MSDRFQDNVAAREALSALADGQAAPHDVVKACAAWKDESDARDAWHSYHLIGDVMRSEELADERGSSAFLQSFRARLAQEPVVLAPHAAQAAARSVATPVPMATPRKRMSWAGPFAVAAGFVMVVGALVSSQVLPTGAGGTLGQMANNADLPAGIQVAGGTVSSPQAFASVEVGAGMSLVPTGDGTQGLAMQGASFSAPEPAAQAVMRDAQLERVLESRRAAVAADASFESQSKLLRPVVFAAP